MADKLEEKLFEKRPNKDIIKYLPFIKNQLFPILESKYNIKMHVPDPLNQRPTQVTYTGKDLNQKQSVRILLQFDCSYTDNEGEINDNELFVTAFWGFAGRKVGRININEPEESAEAIHTTLKELGFRTTTDKEEDKANAEKQEAKKKEDERQKRAKEKADAKQRLSMQLDKEKDSELDTDSDEQDDSIKFPEALDIVFNDFMKKHELNSNIHVTYNNPDDRHEVYSIDVFYTSREKCYVTSEYLGLDKMYLITDTKNYLLKRAQISSPKTLQFSSEDNNLYDFYVWE